MSSIPRKTPSPRAKAAPHLPARVHLQGPRAMEAYVGALNALPPGPTRGRVRSLPPKELLDAGVVLILRLTFILYAEARGLFPLGEDAYDAVALTPMAKALDAGTYPGSGADAFPALMALFEAIYRGDEALGLTAHGGRLFNPTYPSMFWITDEGETLLARMTRRALPILDDGLGAILGGLTGGLPSFEALDVEDLGYLYQPLLGLEIGHTSEGALCIEPSSLRRAQGSHYTPRSLTGPIVAETLSPLLSDAPSGEEILELRVCDMSMGSGAFLMEAVRYLGDALMAAWDRQRRASPLLPLTAPFGHPSTSNEDDRLPGFLDCSWEEAAPERLTLARRLVAERCIYGVDIDPHAVEMGRLSLWLLTFSKGQPFTALDHALAVGDAVFGIGAEEVSSGRIGGEESPIHLLFEPPVGRLIDEAIVDRQALRRSSLRTPADARRRRSQQRRARNAMALLGLMGDLIVAAYMGPGGKRALSQRLEEARLGGYSLVEEWRRLGYPGPRFRRLSALTEAQLGGRIPLHWPFAFPDVFLGDGPPGFDAILGNPPFGNAIDGVTARPEWARLFFRTAFPEAAKGAYDLANLFMVQALRCLKPGGRYGLLQPRSNLSQGSARATQEHLQEAGALTALIAPDNANLFPGASVYVACAIGERRGEEAKEKKSDDPIRVFHTLGGSPRLAELLPGDPWWTLVSGGDLPALGTRRDLRRLGELVDAFAGASTGAAYALRPLIADDEKGPGPKLVTTGLIDRHTCLWGERRARFLKGDFSHPRWPASGADIPSGVRRAMERQTGPKVLVGGLSRRVEAVADLDGELAGVVSTHVLSPKVPGVEVSVLGALVSSWIFSYHYMRCFGAKRMGDGNWTIGKRELLQTAIPQSLWDPGFCADVAELLDEQGQPKDPKERELQRLIAGAYGVRPREMNALKAWYD